MSPLTNHPPQPAPEAGEAVGHARSAPTSPPPSCLWTLDSVVEPLPVERMFPVIQPLEVELGSGDGSFLIEYARLHPERNFLAVERLLGRLRKVERKTRRNRLVNVRGLRIEAGYCLEYLLPPAGVSAIHVYFPDPWPKRRHEMRRLVNRRFPELALRLLAPDGVVHLRTDNPPYFAQMQEVFTAHQGFQPVATPPALTDLKTDFEREFNARGIPTLLSSWGRRPNG